MCKPWDREGMQLMLRPTHQAFGIAERWYVVSWRTSEHVGGCRYVVVDICSRQRKGVTKNLPSDISWHE